MYQSFVYLDVRVLLSAVPGVFIEDSSDSEKKDILTAKKTFLERNNHKKVPSSVMIQTRALHKVSAFVQATGGSIVGEAVLEKLTGYKLTRGVLCALKRKEMLTLEQACCNAKRVAVLENIADATNVGAIFRSAAALGIDAVLLTPECADPLNRRCLRVSMGNVFLVNWARIGNTNDDWPQNGMAKLKSLGFKTLSMALRNNSVDIDDEVLRKEEKLAVLLGTEGDGLLPQTINSSDYVAKIPMKEGVDSLNVAAAAAVILFVCVMIFTFIQLAVKKRIKV